MRRLFSVTVLSFLFVACGDGLTAQETYVDPELAPYVQIYIEECSRFSEQECVIAGLSVTIEDHPKFSEPGSRVAGLCNSYARDNGLPVGAGVILNPEYFERASEVEREILIIHELGHCHWGFYDHITDRPHIMNPSMLSTYYYLTHRDDLLEDLFSL